MQSKRVGPYVRWGRERYTESSQCAGPRVEFSAAITERYRSVEHAKAALWIELTSL